MFANTNNPKILLKLSSAKAFGSGRTKLPLGSVILDLEVKPLFGADSNPGFAATSHKWWVADIKMDSLGTTAPAVNSWDLCHRIVAEGTRIKGANVEFAEPDIEQRWPVESPTKGRNGFAASDDPNRPSEPPNEAYNHFATRDWFRNDRHSGLDTARASHGSIADSDRVRIAHFDTGYDRQHETLPHHIEQHLERNFVDADFPNDASDRTDGILTQLGHGTGTLGILAGKAWGSSGESKYDLGGAPFAKVVPIRVANSVVLFRTSAIAKAFDYVTNLSADPATRIDVVTMSMGGLASQAWAEAVNRSYEAGIFIVTAAGNNYANLPTRFLVYPARFNRVVGACGIQARVHQTRLDPYADLAVNLMAGNYGPDSKVDEAMAAFTPNVPWARIHSTDKVDFNGGGTSSATPQVAAAAANWIQKNRAALSGYQHGWQRVEAIRHALFNSARSWSDHEDLVRKYFGQGVLDTNGALAISPPAANLLEKAKKDSAFFALIRGLGGLGLRGSMLSTAEDMISLEITQLSQTSLEFADAVEEISAIKNNQQRMAELKEVLAEQKGTSAAISKWLDLKSPKKAMTPVLTRPFSQYHEELRIEKAKNPDVARPASRRLRVFSSDPSAALDLDTRSHSEITIRLPWREIGEGPIDEYFEVVDIDPGSNSAYAPVDLNNANILASDGLAPSESDPRFHQQMVYAVASKTVRHFEEALGRPALWSTRQIRFGGQFHDQFVRRLRIYPHALREANAYYSPDKKALLFGYFRERSNTPQGLAPGSTVFTCLSYDIVAHETAHALLDGLHKRYAEITNGDARAFHEAFSDIVALFQHFTHENVLTTSIARAGSNWKNFGPEMTELANQFGRAIGYHGALRSALGLKNSVAEDGKSEFVTIQNSGEESHDKGAVLVAAMFDAYTEIYHRRSADLIRIATQGTGALPDGELHPDLVNRLAKEASKAASHMLRMAIRALDYSPPVGITFGEYLRAVVTSDLDLYPDDDYGYRSALVMAFRRRGIHPEDVSSVTADSLKWDKPEIGEALASKIAGIIKQIDTDVGLRNWKLETDRKKAFEISESAAKILAMELREVLQSSEHGEDGANRIGFTLKTKTDGKFLGKRREIKGFEVHSVRPARRIDAVGQERLDLIIELTQRMIVPGAGGSFRGGATWIIDADTGAFRYIIHKRIENQQRIEEEQQFRLAQGDDLSNNYYRVTSTPKEPFAMAHRGKLGDEK
ncbi:MAG: S8 family serine peptidase [Gammaproteobacteria bacterium]|nr:S8 family serine peptidase [Gammaproteobacteria bacterium]